MIKAGIVGGSGYAAGELIRLLLFHPKVEIKFIFSSSMSGSPVTEAHPDLIGDTNLHFSSSLEKDIDVLFLCTGHGQSRNFLNEHSIPKDVTVIDLSRDFRLSESSSFEQRSFVYGLPELHSNAIKKAGSIANPGCYATAIQLALLPLASEKLLKSDVHVHGITGSTGAGKSLSETTHFSWRHANISHYKAFQHQHLDEIEQSLTGLQPSFSSSINFIPMRGNFTRGIFTTAYCHCDLTIEKAVDLYRDYYLDAPFTHVTTNEVELKQAVGSNKCILKLEKHGNKLLITSIIDNLLKGASGQAVQNMNLIFGLDETSGIQLKTNRF